MSETDLLRWLGSTFILVLLLGGFSVLLRQLKTRNIKTPFNQNSRLHVLETKFLDPKTKLVLAKCDKKEFLFVTGQNGSTLLKEQTAKTDPQDV
jgi:flagellar biogenesis protein FliO